MDEAIAIMTRGAIEYLQKQNKTELADKPEFKSLLKEKFQEVVKEVVENKEVYLVPPQFRALASNLLAVTLYKKGIEMAKLLIANQKQEGESNGHYHS